MIFIFSIVEVMGKNQSSEACKHGEEVLRKGHSTSFTSAYGDELIYDCWIRSCRLRHGSYSWLLTGTANILTVGQSAPI